MIWSLDKSPSYYDFVVDLGCDILHIVEHIVEYVVSAMRLCFISSMSGDQRRTLFAALHLQRTKVQKVSGANVLRYGSSFTNVVYQHLNSTQTSQLKHLNSNIDFDKSTLILIILFLSFGKMLPKVGSENRKAPRNRKYHLNLHLIFIFRQNAAQGGLREPTSPEEQKITPKCSSYFHL